MSDAPSPQPFSLERRFDASCERLFAAWTDPEELKRWFAPIGMTMSQAHMDFRPGGSFLYALKAPIGVEMWGRWLFHEITSPTGFTITQHFSDAAGGVTRHPLSPTWPMRTRSVTGFAPVEGGCGMSIVWTPLDAAPAEIATFDGARPLMQQAWAGTLDQLARHLAA